MSQPKRERETKRQVADKFWAVVSKYDDVNRRLLRLEKEGKIMGGALLVYLSHYQHSYEAMKECGFSFRWKWRQTNLWSFNYYLTHITEAYNKALAFVEEQEAATLENCQKAQVMQKNAEEAAAAEALKKGGI